MSAADPSDPTTPAGWRILERAGLGRFVSRVVYRRPDGSTVEWTSRRARKGLGIGPLDATPAAGRRPVPARTWWIAILFSVGSCCFALGSLPGYLADVSARVDGLTYFVGSIFFTSAAFLSFREAAAAGGAAVGRRILWLRPHSIDWWATVVQFVGTLYFNAMTFLALYDGWSLEESRRLVWRPDVIGSVCFLVASYLAWAEVCHSVGRLRLREWSWWIAVLNLAGSVFFGVSAIGAFVNPSTGEVTSLRLDNGGTFLGALCFLVAAVMLVPEARFTPGAADTLDPPPRPAAAPPS